MKIENKRQKIILFVICILFGKFNLCWSYNWPISPFAGPHGIHGTLGEWRASHLHAGVDIGCAVSTPVYTIDDGTVDEIYGSGNNRGVRVGNKKYTHIDPNLDLVLGSEVTAGVTILGYTLLTHVHFEEDAGGSNPLRVGGLDNYADTSRTYVSTLEFFRQGTETQLTGTIFGQMDILSRARDTQNSPGSQNVSVYRIGYQVQNDEGTIILGPLDNLQFDSVAPGLGPRALVYANFGTRQSDKSTYHYWVTNTMTEDRYWNTKLKKGEAWNSEEDAKINGITSSDGPQYPDGKYKVWVLAYDIKENGGNMATREGAQDVDIIIDNFRPYVREVEVGQGYHGEWSFDGTNLNFNKTSGALGQGNHLVTVLFSEPVNEVTLSIDGGIGYVPLNSIEDPTNQGTAFYGLLSIPGNSSYDGERTMTISARDLAGNQILQIGSNTAQVNPATQLTRDASGNMQGTRRILLNTPMLTGLRCS